MGSFRFDGVRVADLWINCLSLWCFLSSFSCSQVMNNVHDRDGLHVHMQEL